ncbi:MAG TPA: lytic transglycosylase domain-containing protein [Acidobacteriota bacterium]|jgi:soluble lytic murein transglycosylase
MKLMQGIFLFWSFLIFPHISGSLTLIQTAPAATSWEQIIQERQTGNWSLVLEHLQDLQRAQPESYRLRQGDYLKATALRKLNRPQEAYNIFKNLSDKRSILEPLVLWHLFELSKERQTTKDSEGASLWLERYKAVDSPLVDRERADWELAMMAEKTDPQAAQALYQDLMRRRSRYQRAAKLRWSELQEPAARRQAQAQLIAEKQTDEVSYEAARKLVTRIRSLGEPELANLAEIFMNNRDLPLLRKTAEEFIGRFSTSSRLPYFLFVLGRAWMLENEHEKAVQQFEAAYDRFSPGKWGVQSKYFSGHVYLRMEKYPAAENVYRFIIEKHADSEWLGGAYKNLVDSLLWQSRWSDAGEAARQGAARLKSADAAMLYYQAGKILMLDSPREAIAQFQQALRAGDRYAMPPSLGRAEINYWIGRCHEKLDDFPSAAAAYLESARQDTNYFGFLSRDALKTMYASQPGIRNWSDAFEVAALEAKTGGNTQQYRDLLLNRYYSAPGKESAAARSELLSSLGNEPGWVAIARLQLWPSDRIDDSVLRGVSGSLQKRAAAVLAGLGFYQQAADLLSEARDFDSKLQQAYTSATFYGDANHWGEALTQAQKLAMDLPYNMPEFMPPRLVRFYLPRPFSTRSAEAVAGLEPELVSSLILRESRFQPDAKSPAGARGLMQLMLSTARPLAREAGLPPPSADALYDPALSVRLGTLYLNKLFRELQYPEMVVAAYNGGSDNVSRWAKKSQTFEPAVFVSDIGFAETKSYVMRVLGNYRLYKVLYS